MSLIDRAATGLDAPAPDDTPVAGERDEPAVNQAESVQSRTSRILALGLIAILGVGLLIWYYASTSDRQARARDALKAGVASRAQSEMHLPPLGRMDPPQQPATPAVNDHEPESATTIPDEYSSQLPAIPGTDEGMAGSAPYYAAAPTKTPAQMALERRLSGAAFARSTQSAAAPDSNAAMGPSAVEGSSGGQESTLAVLLQPSVTAAARARVLPTQRFVLPRGAFIDCTLETAIDSTLPGMTTCVTATDTFGANGQVVLLERGTKLTGETRGQVRQGSSRVFVLWTEARTPTGVIVPLDSPATDELGRSGLAGRTDRHFWDRFGAAILISTIDAAAQSAARSGQGGGAVIYNPGSSRDLATEVLKDTVNIPPSVVKPQGDRIQILVARDLDFRSVYELRSAFSTR